MEKEMEWKEKTNKTKKKISILKRKGGIESYKGKGEHIWG